MLSDIARSSDSPDLISLDLRPAVKYPMVVIGSHYIAEQITKSSKAFPYSVEKSPTMKEGFVRLIGPNSLLTEEVNPEQS